MVMVASETNRKQMGKSRETFTKLSCKCVAVTVTDGAD